MSSALLVRLDLVVALLAADFFFSAYLSHGAGIITVDKGVGAIAVAAWVLDWAVKRRPILTTPQLWLIIAFLLWTTVSLCFAVSIKTGLVISLRYLTFSTLFFLVLQTVRGDRRKAEVLIKVLITAAVVASVIGLAAFFGHHVFRASGPIQDPNDFAFILGSSTPLAIYLIRWGATWWSKLMWSLALAIILGCTLATFSRSALTGLAAAGLWSAGDPAAPPPVAARDDRAPSRAVAGLAFFLAPQIVRGAFHQKTHIALENVNVRLGYYRVELNEWEHYPITGVGPGNFVYRFYQYAPAVGESPAVPVRRAGHQRGGGLPGHPGRARSGGPGAVPWLPCLVVGRPQAPVPR